jgi:four helix bundle suffix protein
VRLDERLIPKHGGYRKLKSFRLAQLIYDVTVRFCDLYIDRRSRTRDQMVQAARSGTRNIAEGSQASGTSKKTELKLTGVARASLEELSLDYKDYLRHRGLSPWPPDHPALRRFRAARCSTLEEVRAWANDERRRAREGATRETAGHGRTRTGTDEHGHPRDPGTAATTRAREGATRETAGHERTRTGTDEHGHPRDPGNASTTIAPERQSVSVGAGPCPSVSVGAGPSSSWPPGDGPCQSVKVRAGPCPSVPTSVLVANAALSLLNVCNHLLDRQLAAQADAFEREGGFTERLYRVRRNRRGRW